MSNKENELTDGLFDMDVDEAKELATQEFILPDLKGNYTAKIKEALLITSKSGAQAIQISAEINGMNYRFQQEWIRASTAKECKQLSFYQILVQLFAITGILDKGKPRVEPREAFVYDFDTKQMENKLVPQFVQLINREIGVIAVSVPAYKRVLIDGYTKEFEVVKTEPQHIYFEDYSNVVGTNHKIVKFYDHKTMQAFSEKQTNKKPQIVDKMVESLSRRVEKIPSLSEMDKACTKILTTQLSREGAEFFSGEYIPFTQTGGIVFNTQEANYVDNDTGEPTGTVTDKDVPF